MPKRVKMPKRIFLVRHGQSVGNADESAYTTIPDWKVPLTSRGYDTSVESGQKILNIIGSKQAPLLFYCSPYLRTKQTLHGIVQSLGENPIICCREVPQLTEQQFGNFQNTDAMLIAKRNRSSYGRFYYRFPSGESGLDVYNRVSSFIAQCFRDWAKWPNIEDANVVMVTHGLTLRLFLMRWFHYTVEDFERTRNPPNGAVVVLSRIEHETKGHSFVLENESRLLMDYYDTPKDVMRQTWGDFYDTDSLEYVGSRPELFDNQACSLTRMPVAFASILRGIDAPLRVG
jgi:broad specificity phosphatase PhoE